MPVPVSITGSSTISGTVGLAPGASVRIDHTVTNPVPVNKVNDAIQPFQPSNICFGPAGSGGCTVTIFTVPAVSGLLSSTSMDSRALRTLVVR